MMSRVIFVLAFLFAGASAQCDGSCQTNTDSCSGSYQSGLCPGDSSIECCYQTTPSCNGQCQSNNVGLTCDGSYVSGLCPGDDSVTCCVGVRPFADRYWNCADVGCTSVVSSGTGQSNYGCAEFVARSLAAGGFIPNLSGLESQSAYDPYEYKGDSYDLLWVSDKPGGPLGLREFLLSVGWSTGSSIKEASAVITEGSEGSYSHIVIGIGTDECDAHNNARYHITSCSTYYSVDEILNPPGVGEEIKEIKWPDHGPYIKHAKRMEMMGIASNQTA